MIRSLFLLIMLADLVLTSGYRRAQEGMTYAFDVRTRDNLIRFPANAPSCLEFVNKNRTPFAIDFNRSGDVLYAVDGNTLELGTLDQATGQFNAIVQLTDFVGGNPTGLAVDPIDGTFYISSASDLHILDIETGVALWIGSFTDTGTGSIETVIDIAIDASGQMYAHELGGNLWTVDKESAASTFIGSSGLDSNFAQGMDFDPDSDLLYAAIYTGNGMGSYGIWNVTNGVFKEILDLQSFGEVELELAIVKGRAYAYDIRGSHDSFITFQAELPLPLESEVVIPVYYTFAMDFAADGTTLFIFDALTNTFGKIDSRTGCFTPLAVASGDIVNTVTGISCDPTTGTFYAVQDGILGDDLLIVDVETGVGELVANFTSALNPLIEIAEIAFDAEGELYAFDLLTDTLYTVDKISGFATPIGSLKVNAFFPQGMDFDPVTDTLYQAIYTGGGTGSYGFWDLDAGVFTEILPLEAFEDPIGTGYELEMAISGASKGCDFALGDVNQDGIVSLLDVDPFVALLTKTMFQCEADINQDGAVTLLDVDPFVAILTNP